MAVNVANILALADFLESVLFPFDMAKIHNPASCGSAGCIGGHAAALWPDVASNYSSWDESKLADKLGIDDDTEEALCYLAPGSMWGSDPNYVVPYDDVTREDAVAVLRNLAKTGKVDWSFVIDRVQEKDRSE